VAIAAHLQGVAEDATEKLQDFQVSNLALLQFVAVVFIAALSVVKYPVILSA
jgi:hypothetical protein